MAKPFEIQKRHHIAAKALLKGETIVNAGKLAGVSENTILRWRRRPEFQNLLEFYSESAAAVERLHNDPGNLDLFRSIPAEESPLIQKLAEMLDRLSGLILKRLEAVDDAEVVEMPLRLIPQFMRAYTEGIAALQGSNDRASGYQLIVAELTKILESESIKGNN